MRDVDSDSIFQKSVVQMLGDGRVGGLLERD